MKQQCDVTAHILEWPKLKALKIPNSGKMWTLETLIPGGNAKWYSHFGRQFSRFLTKLNIKSKWSSNFTKVLVCVWRPKTSKAPHKTYHECFIEALVIITKTGSKQRCPSVGKWTNFDKVDYCSVVTRNELLFNENMEES